MAHDACQTNATPAELAALDEPVRKVVLHALLSGERAPVAFDADGTLWRGDVGEELLRWLAH